MRRRNFKTEVMVGSRVLPPETGKAVLAQVSESFHNTRLRRRLERCEMRHRHTPERLSVEKAMLAVEERFVAAMWVLERALPQEGVAGYGNRAGMDYLREEEDHWLAGRWQHIAPRPAVPSGREIDAARKAHGWVRHLDELQARVLTVGAMSKRGDSARKVNWNRVRSRLPEIESYTVRHLQGLYSGALRAIVGALTMERLAA